MICLVRSQVEILYRFQPPSYVLMGVKIKF